MDEVIRALAVYAILLLIFRVSGKRSLAETTTFDFVLLLIFSEALQSALVDEDSSLTAAVVVIMTLVVLNIGMSLLKERSSKIELLMEGAPIRLIERGELLYDRMRRARIDEGDILAAARQTQGIEQMDQIESAVLERSGGISIIPKGASS
ncbi:MAG TPA: YetF domain-containing protein [Thermomicrobiales bacterium]|nr:YetF domain-containing protein [Thermomicrobiales bacterium]